MRPLKLVPDNTNIAFLKYRTIAMALSIGLIVGSIVLCFVNGFNLGVDFVGGQSVRVSFHAFDPLWPDLGWWNLPLLLLAVTMLAFSFWPPAEGDRFGPDPRIEPEPVTN